MTVVVVAVAVAAAVVLLLLVVVAINEKSQKGWTVAVMEGDVSNSGNNNNNKNSNNSRNKRQQHQDGINRKLGDGSNDFSHSGGDSGSSSWLR